MEKSLDPPRSGSKDFSNYSYRLIIHLFNFQNGVRRNRSNCGQDMAIFRFFKTVAATILYFRNFKFLTGEVVKRVVLRHRAKFRWNRSNRGRDITIFRFFQDGGRPPSWIWYACVGTTHEGHLLVFITVQNLVGINVVVLIICTFFDFAGLAWKCLFMPQNWGVLTTWVGSNVNKSKKRAHPCASPQFT